MGDAGRERQYCHGIELAGVIADIPQEAAIRRVGMIGKSSAVAAGDVEQVKRRLSAGHRP